jgi:hypothetical protein
MTQTGPRGGQQFTQLNEEEKDKLLTRPNLDIDLNQRNVLAVVGLASVASARHFKRKLMLRPFQVCVYVRVHVHVRRRLRVLVCVCVRFL